MGILRTDKISGLESPTSNDFGPNLLYNGDFSNGSVGWSAVNSNHTVSSGQLTITNTGSNGRATSSAFDTVIGETYEISIHNVSTTGQFRLEIREGGGYGSENAFDSNNSVAGVRTLRFVATETAHAIAIYAIGGSGTVSVYSDITVRKINKLVTGSVYFDGGDDYIAAPANTPELLLGDADFTIEGWFYKTNTGQQDAFGLYQTANSRRSYLLTVGDSSTIFYYNYTGSSGTNVSTKSTLPLNKWIHVAITRDGTNIKLYFDGKLVGTNTVSNGAYANTNDQFMIGSSDYSNANGSEWTGYISNFRIVKGHVLYDGNFTVPKHALEVVPGTVLLACNNPDSVTASESALIGKGLTLTASGNPTFVTENPGLSRDFTYGTEFRGVTTFDTQAYFVPPSGTTTDREELRSWSIFCRIPKSMQALDQKILNI